MNFHLKALLYRILIDPLISGVRQSIIKSTTQSSTVLDIACGTGTLAIDMADSGRFITAIDLDTDLISYATERASRRGMRNITFKVLDASDLSMFGNKEFNFAVTSMAVHQFEPQLAISILSGMKRIASTVIIADYNYPMHENIAGLVAHGIEKMAGGDHYLNFRNYMKMGGITYFTGKAGLEIKSSVIRGSGVFIVVTTA
jgi:2-polyprenyl-3-methyl-5-hydroxy-6-metoxy-1,4-benzoquinol methylase